jgi:1,4-alpha-glucan branching enzyme
MSRAEPFSMNLLQENPHGTWPSSRTMAKPINFYHEAPKAKTVCLVGDYNNWNPTSDPMERRVDGWWLLQVPLTHGHHQYQFMVDGKPVLDPHATGVARNERNEQVSLIAVS